MMKRFFLGLVLFFSFGVSFSGVSYEPSSICELPDGRLSSNDLSRCVCSTLDSGCEHRPVDCTKCFISDCFQISGSDICHGSVHEACSSVVYNDAGYHEGDTTFTCKLPGGGSRDGIIKRNVIVCDSVQTGVQKTNGASSCDTGNPDDPCGNGKDPATCDMDDPPPDNPDDPCGNGKDPATCDMDDPPPDDPDDPCGNGKDPETCDIDDDPDNPPKPDTPIYDDDYEPDKPPCQIMVNGKCVFDDPDRKDKICSNGKCKCFKKNENGILKEVPCIEDLFKPGDTSNKRYDYGICTDDGCSCWSEGVAGLFPCNEGEFVRPGNTSGDDSGSGSDSKNDTFNPNSQYDDATYNFDGLDTSTNLPDAEDIKDKTQKVDLSSWGVNDYFNSSGQCPAPSTVSLGMFGSFEVSYEYFCSIARILRTVVISFSWLTGLLIIAKVNK